MAKRRCSACGGRLCQYCAGCVDEGECGCHSPMRDEHVHELAEERNALQIEVERLTKENAGLWAQSIALQKALQHFAFQRGRVLMAAETFRTYAVAARCPGGERSYRKFWKQLHDEIQSDPNARARCR